jgi:hypothetical protein
LFLFRFLFSEVDAEAHKKPIVFAQSPDGGQCIVIIVPVNHPGIPDGEIHALPHPPGDSGGEIDEVPSALFDTPAVLAVFTHMDSVDLQVQAPTPAEGVGVSEVPLEGIAELVAIIPLPTQECIASHKVL